MSNIGKRQLGPFQKAFKYQFTLQIQEYRCQVPLPCTLKFMWKRNNKGIETKNQIKIQPGKINQLIINEKLSSISTIIYNSQRKEFLPKESELIANMIFTGSPKKLASCHIDMKNILDANNYRSNRSQLFEVVMNTHVTSSKQNRITYRLSSIYKEQVVFSQKSIGNGSLNMSGISIPQDVNKFFQKRYEVVPSKDNKDTHSVTSYNPNPNRYPSAKRERDDSSSIRKFDYGYLASLKSNISNNANDIQGKSNKKSVDNKTEMNQTYNNRQLIDQQNKRSKAEAELGKNKVEIEQLKKKVSQLVIENMKLKQQSKKVALQKEYNSKEEINYQQKIYEINNQLRMARNQIQGGNQQLKRMQAELKNSKNQKLYIESQVQKKQKRIQQLMKNEINPRMLQSIQNENTQLKYQVETTRRFIQEIKRQQQQKQSQLLSDKYREVQQLSFKLQSVKKQNQKLRSNLSTSQVIQKKLYELEEELKQKLNELTTKTRYIIEIQKELQEYKNRLTQYETQKVFMQRQIIKLKQTDKKEADKNRLDLQQKMEKLQQEIIKLSEQRNMSQQIIEEKHRHIARLEQQKASNEGKSSQILIQANQIQRKYNECENDNRALKQRLNRLQQNNRELSQSLSKIKQESNKQMKASTSPSPQMDRMFRQSLQMQVELKFANDQLVRLKNIEQAYENEKWRAQNESSQRQNIEGEYERVEKELVSKNRALMIEVQKTKMMNEQLNQLQYNYNLLREELQKNRNIIYSGQQQLTQMEQAIIELQNMKNGLEVENGQLKNEKHMLLVNNQEVRQLQIKVRQLEQRNAQKLVSLQTSNNNLVIAHKQIKQYQKISEERQQLLTLKQKQIYQLQLRLREVQHTKTLNQSEINKVIQQKNSLQKRMAMTIQEMHVMKKKYEEQKGRSISFNRNQQVHKMRIMESEMEKKQKHISKLSKEKLQLQEQNVKMNVQIMKLLGQLQRFRSMAPNNQSLRNITHSLN